INATVQDASVTVSSNVPEPSSFLLLSGGLLLFIRLRLRRLAYLFLLTTPLLCMGQSFDTTPPTLASFSFTPNAVNVTSGPQTVTVSLNVTDDLSGVLGSKAFVQVQLQSPTGNQTELGFG